MADGNEDGGAYAHSGSVLSPQGKTSHEIINMWTHREENNSENS